MSLVNPEELIDNQEKQNLSQYQKLKHHHHNHDSLKRSNALEINSDQEEEEDLETTNPNSTHKLIESKTLRSSLDQSSISNSNDLLQHQNPTTNNTITNNSQMKPSIKLKEIDQISLEIEPSINNDEKKSSPLFSSIQQTNTISPISTDLDQLEIEDGDGDGEGEHIDHVHHHETFKEKFERITKPIAGTLYMTLGAFSFSTMTLTAKLATDSGVPSFEVLLVRNGFMLFAAVATLIYTKDYPWKVKKEHRIPLLTRGILAIFAQSCYFYALTTLDISTAVTLQFTAPVMSSLIAIPLLKEKPTRYDAIGCVLCLIGVVLCTKPVSMFTKDLDLNRIIGISCSLIAAFVSAISTVLIRKLGASGVSPFMIIFSVSLICTIFAPFGMLMFEDPSSWLIPNVAVGLFLTMLGIGGTFGQVLQNKAFSLEPVAKLSSIGYIQICFAFLLQIIVFNEFPDWFGIGGATLISTWAVVVVVRSWRKSRQEATSSAAPTTSTINK